MGAAAEVAQAVQIPLLVQAAPGLNGMLRMALVEAAEQSLARVRLQARRVTMVVQVVVDVQTAGLLD